VSAPGLSYSSCSILSRRGEWGLGGNEGVARFGPDPCAPHRLANAVAVEDEDDLRREGIRPTNGILPRNEHFAADPRPGTGHSLAVVAEKISACIMTGNEERKIRRCLASVAWCDEIVVLDSFSTDGTLAICREFTDRIHQHEWLGYVGQRNLLRQHARHPWLLYLDSDEEVSPALRDEIRWEMEANAGAYAGYEFPRLVYYLGRWIRHGEWYPDVKLRLFLKEAGRSEGIEPHDYVAVNGAVKRLRHPVWHYTYDDLRDHLETVNRFSTLTAQQKFMRGERFRWLDLIFRPPLHFLKGYILKRGFLDGTHGFVIALMCGYGAFLKYGKLWELELRRRRNFRELPDPEDRTPHS
jgi:glycosyltransferase involved in cell wall biosynthesis